MRDNDYTTVIGLSHFGFADTFLCNVGYQVSFCGSVNVCYLDIPRNNELMT